MRAILIGFLLLATAAQAAPVTALWPKGAEARQARLLIKMGPQARGWIKQEAKDEAAQGAASVATASNAAALYGKAQVGLGSADIQALAFLMMMQVARNSDQDLQDISHAMQAMRGSKQPPADMQRMIAMQIQFATDRRDRMIQAVAAMMTKAGGDSSVQNMK